MQTTISSLPDKAILSIGAPHLNERKKERKKEKEKVMSGGRWTDVCTAPPPPMEMLSFTEWYEDIAQRRDRAGQ